MTPARTAGELEADMPTGLISSSLSALYAAQAGIQATQRNIAGANTPGFHRQAPIYTSGATLPIDSSAIGTGVNVANLSRAYDRFLESNLLLNQGLLSRHETYANYASQVDSLLGDTSSSLSTFLSGFFASAQEVANDPTSMPARQAMLSKGQILATRLNAFDGVLSEMGQDVDQQLRDLTGQVTTYSRQIASINGRLMTAQSAGDTTATNELLDQRDRLVGEINKLITVTVVEQGVSGYSLYVGSGQPLVVGSQSNTLAVAADPSDPSKLAPVIQTGNYSETVPTSQIAGGQIAGLLAFRDEVLVPSQRELGTLAYALATEFNSLHAAGYGLDGVSGRDFFTTPALRGPLANAGNTGNGAISLAMTDIGLLAESDYRLAYDGANYTLTRLSDGTSYSNASLAGLSAAVSTAEGFSLTLTSGTINSGDSYLIRPTQGAAASIAVVAGLLASHIAAAGDDPASPGTSLGRGDNSNALLLAGMAGSKLLGGGVNTLASAYGQLVGRNATLANGADLNLTAYEHLTEQAMAAQQSVSGINLDEEAANLLQFQQLYQAAARALQTSSTLFDNILAIGA
jgi:flagellar hook-associated protein 1 FlgK